MRGEPIYGVVRHSLPVSSFEPVKTYLRWLASSDSAEYWTPLAKSHGNSLRGMRSFASAASCTRDERTRDGATPPPRSLAEFKVVIAGASTMKISCVPYAMSHTRSHTILQDYTDGSQTGRSGLDPSRRCVSASVMPQSCDLSISRGGVPPCARTHDGNISSRSSHTEGLEG